jgi:hypothetical protein
LRNVLAKRKELCYNYNDVLGELCEFCVLANKPDFLSGFAREK